MGTAFVKPKLWDHQVDAIRRALAVHDFAFFMEMGCLSHDMEVRVNVTRLSRKITMEQLFRVFNRVELTGGEKGWRHPVYVRSDKGGIIGLNRIAFVKRSGEKQLYKITWGKHCHLKATVDHEVLTQRGYVCIGELKIGQDFIAVDTLKKHQKKPRRTNLIKKRYSTRQVGKYHPYGYKNKLRGKRIFTLEIHRIIFDANINKISVADFIRATKEPNNLKFTDPALFHIHHKDDNHKNNVIENLERLGAKEHLRHHCRGYKNFEHGVIGFRKILSRKAIGIGMTYDIGCIAPHHNFVANGAVVHNCGKTRTLIETLCARYKEAGKPLRTLIITPPAVVSQLRDEWIKYSDISSKQVVCLQGSGAKRLKVFNEMAAAPRSAKIFITNYEALLMNDLFEAFCLWQPEAIAFDESQKIKSPGSKRSKLAAALANPYDKRAKAACLKPFTYLLSGTPILNSPMDLFQQFKVLDGGESFGGNYFSFRAKYFRDRNANMPSHKHFPLWEIRTIAKDGFDALSEINRIMFEKSIRVEKSQCLTLPPEVDVTIKVGMTKEQNRLYQEMKNDLVTYLGSKACVATMALTKALRLLQISSGFLSVKGDDEQVDISLNDTPKREALKELLEEICENPKHKVIVWTVWRETYGHVREICSALKLGCVEIHGAISQNQKRDNVDAFRNDPNIRVLVGHPQSGGVGLNLVEAGYSIRYSRTFSLEEYLQSRARNHRGGSLEAGHKSITHYEIVTEGTIDEVVLKKLSQKIDLSDKLLSNLAQELLHSEAGFGHTSESPENSL